MVYLGIQNTYTLRGEGRFAICGARAKRHLPNRRVAAADVPVELRGAGNCSRQVHNFGTAGVFEADSLIACEVITPGGNWSSYPAHKHDENTPVETRSRRSTTSRSTDSPGAGIHRGFGYHRVYGTPDRPIEVLEEVRSRRRRPRPARLPRPVDRGARPPHVLPERDGRSGRRTGLDDRRRSRACLAARHLGSTRMSTPALPLQLTRRSDVVSKASVLTKTPDAEPTVRLTVAQATIRFLANQYVERDGRTHQVLRRLLRHLRPRQCGGHRPGAAAGRGRIRGRSEPELRYVLGRNEQAMVHTAVGLCATDRTACRPGR